LQGTAYLSPVTSFQGSSVASPRQCRPGESHGARLPPLFIDIWIGHPFYETHATCKLLSYSVIYGQKLGFVTGDERTEALLYRTY